MPGTGKETLREPDLKQLATSQATGLEGSDSEGLGGTEGSTPQEFPGEAETSIPEAMCSEPLSKRHRGDVSKRSS